MKKNKTGKEEIGNRKPKPKEPPPNNPEKYIPTKKDDDNDLTRPKPGPTDPQKADPTRIEEPHKNNPVRIK